MARKKTESTAKKTSGGTQPKPLRLVLLDAHAITHRAYHALPELATSRGEPTGALFGLVSTLIKISSDLKPDYLIAARDLPGTTHRHELFEAYKATRAKTDDQLVEQLKRAPIVYEAFGIPVYDRAGFEADDIIGTIVQELSARRDIEVIVTTGDMDMLQLVSGTVRVYKMRGSGVGDLHLYDAEAVKEEYGFPPEEVPDFKGIRGDPSDNIKGVPGVGEVTAVKLLQTFGPLERIYEALKKHSTEEIAEKAGVRKQYVEKMKEHESDAIFSKELATIKRDVPIAFALPRRRWELVDHVQSISTLCDLLEFRALKERLHTITDTKSVAASPAQSGADRPTIDPTSLRETAVALWLVHSDIANPTLEDITRVTKTDDFERAREIIFTELQNTGRLAEVYEKIEKPLIPITDRMREIGIYVDKKKMAALSREYSKELGDLAGRIFSHVGHEFNINSPKQLGDVLYDELKITPERQRKTATGARTTREEELVKLAPQHPIIKDILSYRELQKLLSTYIDKIPDLVAKDGRLHAEFLQAGSSTGRMASQNPNLQNIPIKTDYGRRIRTAFAAEKGFVLAAIDYSQIELRIAAGLSGDEKLVDVFKRGGDVHTAVAAEVFEVPPEHVDYEMRRRAKVINFGILYGMGVNALRANLGESVSREEAATFLAQYFRDFSGLARYIERTKSEAAAKGYTETLFGRRRYFPGFKSALPNLRAQAERMAINAPMQGTQSDIIKLAMVEADRTIEEKGWRGKARLLLQVHDELVYEVDEKESETIARELKRVMESVAPIERLSGVPIVAEISIGHTWGDVQKIKTT